MTFWGWLATVTGWWAGVQPGSAAEWASGIGTVGAFIFGFVLLRREIRRDRSREDSEFRREADAVSAWAETSQLVSGLFLGGERRITIFNGGSLPVMALEIVMVFRNRQGKSNRLSYRLGATRNGMYSIPLGPRSGAVLDFYGIQSNIDEPVQTEAYVRFTTGDGRRWLRLIKDPAALSEQKSYFEPLQFQAHWNQMPLANASVERSGFPPESEGPPNLSGQDPA